jgi:hypothetical protein
MTALPIILGAKEYKAYLAARTGSTNLINDKLIKTLRMNASLFVEPKTQMLTAVGTEIPCGGPFQPRYSFPSFMACLLARQEGSKRKPTKDNRYRQLNMARNCPHERLVLTRKADPSSSTPSRTSTSSAMVPTTSSIQRSWPSSSHSSKNRQS